MLPSSSQKYMGVEKEIDEKVRFRPLLSSFSLTSIAHQLKQFSATLRTDRHCIHPTTTFQPLCQQSGKSSVHSLASYCSSRQCDAISILRMYTLLFSNMCCCISCFFEWDEIEAG